MSFKSGFIGLIGRPNAGKSTLLNALLNQKVAITTAKPQTTRNVIRGIKTTADYQMVFVDTPGIHRAHHELGRQMNKQAFSTISGVDIIYYLTDGSKPISDGEHYLLRALNNVKIPVFLVVNKLDKLNASEKLDVLALWAKQGQFAEVIPISALRNKNLDTLLEVTLKYLPDKIMYYPKDQVSDYPEEFMITEMIREPILNCTEQEIPHSVAVILEKKVRKNNILILNAVVYVERESQKGILIGKNGSMIKKISTLARQQLEYRLDCKVYLEIFIRVEADWRNKARDLKELGYMAGDKDE